MPYKSFIFAPPSGLQSARPESLGFFPQALQSCRSGTVIIGLLAPEGIEFPQYNISETASKLVSRTYMSRLPNGRAAHQRGVNASLLIS